MLWTGASDRPPVMGASGGGKPKNHPSPLSQSPWRPGGEGAGGPPGHAQRELPQLPREEAWCAGVDWSCVDLVWEFC